MRAETAEVAAELAIAQRHLGQVRQLADRYAATPDGGWRVLAGLHLAGAEQAIGRAARLVVEGADR